LVGELDIGWLIIRSSYELMANIALDANQRPSPKTGPSQEGALAAYLWEEILR
jgi:hypothetical protein